MTPEDRKITELTAGYMPERKFNEETAGYMPERG